MPQRSPVIFWLLLAATISVDAVLISLLASEPYSGPLYVVVAFHAMILSQLSVVCIWSALAAQKGPWTRLAPIPAALLAAQVTAMFVDKPVTLTSSFANHLAYFGIHAASLLALLWLLQRTAFWRRRSGSSLPLQFSLAHLLVMMTVVAVLASTIRSSPFFGDERWINILFLCSSVALAMASVCIWNLARVWWNRLAGVLFIAFLLASFVSFASVVTESSGSQWIVSMILGAHFEIQGLVLSVWLGCGPILPPQSSTAAES
jgi:hypothetical protein